MIKDVTDLNVYQKSLELLPSLYKLTSQLPLSEKDLMYQVRRAAKSISANIAEGFGKRFFEKEFKRYVLNSLGSSDEVISHLRTISILVPELQSESDELILEYKILSRKLNTLYKHWHFEASL